MIDGGKDPGQHQTPPNWLPLDRLPLDRPPLDIRTIYSWVTIQGAGYRDFCASRQEVRARFSQRLLLKERVEASRRAREQAASAPVEEHPRNEETVPGNPAPGENEVSAGANEARIQHQADDLESAPAHSGAHEHDPGPDTEAASDRAPAEAESGRQQNAGSGSRWFALRSVLAGDSKAGTDRSAGRPLPMLAIFSLAGGVGKTSLAATLCRVLASRGEQIFLAETTSPGLLPLFFGSRKLKPGVVRTFSPPAGSDDAAVRAVTLDPHHFSESKEAPEQMAEALLRYGRGSNRILIDIQTGSKAVAQRLRPVVSTVLVPLLADMSSIMSLHAVEAVFAPKPETNPVLAGGSPIQPVYLLNQFDGTLPLHAEVRGLLQERLGGRLLPLVVRRSAAVSEALAEGMTVVDYAPGSPVTEDYVRLADWLVTAAPLAASALRGLRWSEI